MWTSLARTGLTSARCRWPVVRRMRPRRPTTRRAAPMSCERAAPRRPPPPVVRVAASLVMTRRYRRTATSGATSSTQVAMLNLALAPMRVRAPSLGASRPPRTPAACPPARTHREAPPHPRAAGAPPPNQGRPAPSSGTSLHCRSIRRRMSGQTRLCSRLRCPPTCPRAERTRPSLRPPAARRRSAHGIRRLPGSASGRR